MNEPDYNDLCVGCEEHRQYRNGLCWNCWNTALDRRAEERHDREVIELQERREAND